MSVLADIETDRILMAVGVLGAGLYTGSGAALGAFFAFSIACNFHSSNSFVSQCFRVWEYRNSLHS